MRRIGMLKTSSMQKYTVTHSSSKWGKSSDVDVYAKSVDMPTDFLGSELAGLIMQYGAIANAEVIQGRLVGKEACRLSSMMMQLELRYLPI